MEKKLYRDEHRKVIGGVCAGLAEYFGYDIAIVRAVFLGSAFLKGVGIVPYFILWIVLPKRPYIFDDPTMPGFKAGFNANFGQPGFKPGVDYTVPPVGSKPYNFMPPKKSSNAGMVFGIALIVLGSIFLLDQFDFIPDFDFERLWPVVLVAIGITLIFTGKKRPWEKEGWTAPNAPVADEPVQMSDEIKAEEEKRSAFDLTKKSNDETNTNPPII